MSEIEFLYENFFDEDEDEVINHHRELITMVQANRFLYDKTDKLYANGDIKIEAWKQIGASLTHPLEGPIAERKFYALRQRFGKERRKIIQSMPRSGAGTDQPIYTPTWVLYKDLTFLEDIIKPRKTSSNYKAKVPANSQVSTSISSSFLSTPDGKMFNAVSPISSTAVSSNISSSWKSDLHTNFTRTDESSTDVSEDASLPFSITSAPVVTSESHNVIAPVQRAMTKIGTKRKIPPSDTFANKKRQETDTVNKLLIEQSKGLTDLAVKIGQVITAPSVPSNVLSAVGNCCPSTQPMLSAIEFALRLIPEHVQLECLIGVLQYISDFSNNSKSGQS